MKYFLKQIMKSSIKSMISAGVFTFTVIAIVVYASGWTDDVTTETPLTATLWNELKTEVVRVGTIVIPGFVDTTTTLGTSNTKVPSQNAVKTYVDAQVGAAGGSTTCPSEISDQQSSATLANAVNTCRNLTTDGGGRRLPTFEELSCFILNPNNSTILWTRTPSSSNAGYYLVITLSVGGWGSYTNTASYAFRCVR
ncbi:MAG: hypothetical protein PHH06_02590 [Candidatus Gracilibacteria bacterium]|nr:hypothetical protein [Candidatus Gracilibacteria bacterium]